MHALIDACMCNSRIVSGHAGEASDWPMGFVWGGQLAAAGLVGGWFTLRLKRRRSR